MKLNHITTPNGANNTTHKPILEQAVNETWSLYCLAGLGKQAAFNEVTDVGTIAHLLETIEQRIEAVHYSLDELRCKGSSPAPAGTEAQALLTLLLQLLKQWRAQAISGNEFEAALEQAVSLASSLNLNPVTEIKGGKV